MKDLKIIYHSYKNKITIYYDTAIAEEKLLAKRNKFKKTLSPEQIIEFSELEKSYYKYKNELIKEIIDYSIRFDE